MRHLQKKHKPKIGFRSSKKSSLVKTVQENGGKNSKCNICLTMIQDPTYLNPCNHQFCFKCIQKWSRRQVICPLCKQRFYSYRHTVGRKDVFSEYVLPLNALSFSPSEESKEDCASASSQRLTSAPDNGIVHNEIRGTLTQRQKDIYQLMRQFAVTGRPNDIDLISLGKFKAQAVIQFRRTLYQAGIVVQNAPNPDFSQISSAEFFGRNPQCLDRVIPWLKRELKVLFGNKRSTIHTLQNLILSNLIHHDLDSREFEAILQPHLHHFTSHFLHEFMSFVQSSLHLRKYDWCALYECPAIWKETDLLTSSLSSENEHLQPPEKSQVPKPNGNLDYGNLAFFLPDSEKAPPSTFAGVDNKNHSTIEENYMDLPNKDTERGIVTAYRIIKNILRKTPSEEKVLVPGSLSHSHLFQGQKGKRDIVEIDPVQILKSTDMETGKNQLVDNGAFKVYHKSSANIITVKTLGKKDITKTQPSEISINELKEYSPAWSKTLSPKRRGVHKNSGSKGSIECKFDEACSASKERRGGRKKGKYLHDEKKCKNYSRDRRHRRDQRKTKTKETSLLHKNPLPIRKKSTEARDTRKSKSQNIHHKRKMKNKVSEHLGSGSSSEPNQNGFYTKVRLEEPQCRKGKSDILCDPNPPSSSEQKHIFFLQKIKPQLIKDI